MIKLRELREEKHLNMRQTSMLLNMPYTTYVSYEKGDREPNSEVLAKLATFFDCSIDYLVGRSNDRKHNENTPYKMGGRPSIILPNSPYKVGDSPSIIMPNSQYKISEIKPKPNAPRSISSDKDVKVEVCGIDTQRAEVRAKTPIVYYPGTGKTHVKGVVPVGAAFKNLLTTEVKASEKEKYINQAVKKLESMSESDLKDMFTIMEYLEYRKDHSKK